MLQMNGSVRLRFDKCADSRHRQSSHGRHARVALLLIEMFTAAMFSLLACSALCASGPCEHAMVVAGGAASRKCPGVLQHWKDSCEASSNSHVGWCRKQMMVLCQTDSLRGRKLERADACTWCGALGLQQGKVASPR